MPNIIRCGLFDNAALHWHSPHDPANQPNSLLHDCREVEASKSSSVADKLGPVSDDPQMGSPSVSDSRPLSTLDCTLACLHACMPEGQCTAWCQCRTPFRCCFPHCLLPLRTRKSASSAAFCRRCFHASSLCSTVWLPFTPTGASKRRCVSMPSAINVAGVLKNSLFSSIALRGAPVKGHCCSLCSCSCPSRSRRGAYVQGMCELSAVS